MVEINEAVPNAIAVPEPSSHVRVSGASVLARQRWGAFVTVLLPTASSALAIYLALERGVHESALVAWVIMHFATVIGITVGFHRLAAHRTFDATPTAQTALLVLGSFAAEGPVIHWASNHRRHHQYSDQPEDVHSPHKFGASTWQLIRGFWHAHVGWMFQREVTNSMRYSRDLLRDPRIMRVNRLYLLWVAIGLLVPALAVGLFERSWLGLLDGLLWAGFVRMFVVHHVTWAINSLTHLHGQRPYETADHSHNVAWLALPSAGEAWHNCHHAFPGSARLGLAWWQVDLGYMVIWTLSKLRLVSDVKVPSPAARARARRFPAERKRSGPRSEQSAHADDQPASEPPP